MNTKLQIFDSTLRDGAQSANISFSVEDKLKVIETLDELGVDFIEAGNPYSNPAEMQFFQRVQALKLKRSKLVAFGSTRRKNISCEEDSNLKSLLAANTEYVAIFGKSHIDEIALQYHLPVLARLPIDPSVAQKMDDGAAEQLPTADLQAAVETILQLG